MICLLCWGDVLFSFSFLCLFFNIVLFLLFWGVCLLVVMFFVNFCFGLVWFLEPHSNLTLPFSMFVFCFCYFYYGFYFVVVFLFCCCGCNRPTRPTNKQHENKPTTKTPCFFQGLGGFGGRGLAKGTPLPPPPKKRPFPKTLLSLFCIAFLSFSFSLLLIFSYLSLSFVSPFLLSFVEILKGSFE